MPVLLAVVLIVVLLLGGCARVRTALAVQSNDTVAGEIVLATPEIAGPAQAVTLPPDLVSLVEVVPYREEGYVGSVLRFSALSFGQLSTLAEAAGPSGDAVEFTLRRVGGRLLVDGKVNLKSASGNFADFQLKISFPGEVLDHDGELEGRTVSWTFAPPEARDFTAVVAQDDPGAPSVLGWTLGLGAAVTLVALAVAVLARRARNPPLTPPIR